MKAINSNKQFNDLVNSGKPFVLDFYADWCGPCQALLPTVEKLSKEFEGQVEILKVNVDEQRDLAGKFNIRSIPAIFFLQENKVVDRSIGVASETALRNKVAALV
jgi:thioredoxin